MPRLLLLLLSVLTCGWAGEMQTITVSGSQTWHYISGTASISQAHSACMSIKIDGTIPSGCVVAAYDLVTEGDGGSYRIKSWRAYAYAYPGSTPSGVVRLVDADGSNNEIPGGSSVTVNFSVSNQMFPPRFFTRYNDYVESWRVAMTAEGMPNIGGYYSKGLHTFVGNEDTDGSWNALTLGYSWPNTWDIQSMNVGQASHMWSWGWNNSTGEWFGLRFSNPDDNTNVARFSTPGWPPQIIWSGDVEASEAYLPNGTFLEQHLVVDDQQQGVNHMDAVEVPAEGWPLFSHVAVTNGPTNDGAWSPDAIMTFTASPDAWSRTGGWSAINWTFMNAYGTGQGRTYAAIARANDPPKFEQAGPYTIRINRPTIDGEPVALPQAHLVINNFLPMLTPGGVYGDPWEEIHPTGAASPTNTDPEDQIIGINAQIVIGGGGSIPDDADIPGGGNFTTSSNGYLTIGALSVKVSLDDLQDDSLTGGRRRKANLDAVISSADLVLPTYAVKVTVTDNFGASYSQVIQINTEIGDDSPPSTPEDPPPAYLLIDDTFSSETFINKYLVTFPPSARNGSFDTLFHLRRNDAASKFLTRFKIGKQRLYDWHVAETGSMPVFPGLNAYYSLPSSVPDDYIIKKDGNQAWRGFVVPLNPGTSIPSSAWRVVGVTDEADADASADFSAIPEVYKTTGSRSIGIRFKLLPDLVLPDHSKKYFAKLNLRPEVAPYLNIPTDPLLSVPFRVMDLAGQSFRAMDHAIGMEFTKSSPISTPLPPSGAVGADGQILMPFIIDQSLMESSGIFARWFWDSPIVTLPRPIGYTTSAVDVGSGLSDVVSTGDGTVSSANGKASVVRSHRLRLNEVATDGSSMPFKPNIWWTTGAAVDGGSSSDPRITFPAITALDTGDMYGVSGRITDDLGRESLITTGGLSDTNDPARYTATAAEQARVSQLGLTPYLTKRMGISSGPNWASYTNSLHWSIFGSVSHSGTAESAIASDMALVDANGTTVLTFPSSSIQIGSLASLVGSTGLSWLSAAGCPASDDLVAIVPMGAPNSWNTGLATAPMVMAAAQQRQSGFPSTQTGYNGPIAFPVVSRNGLTYVLLNGAAYCIENGRTTSTGATAADTYILRSDDIISLVLVLHSHYTYYSTNYDKDYQWTGGSALARFDLLDSRQTHLAPLDGEPPVLTVSQGRVQPIGLRVDAVNWSVAPKTGIWLKNGTQVRSDALTAASIWSYYENLYQIPLSNLAALGMPSTVTINANEITADRISIASYYSYANYSVAGGLFHWYDTNTWEEMSAASITVSTTDGFYLYYPHLSNPPTDADTVVTMHAGADSYAYQLVWDGQEVGWPDYYNYTFPPPGTVRPTTWSWQNTSVDVASHTLNAETCWDPSKNAFVWSIGTPASVGYTDGLILWPDRALAQGPDVSKSYVGLSSDGTTTWYQSNGTTWSVFNDTLQSTGSLTGALHVPSSSELFLAVPQGNPNDYVGYSYDEYYGYISYILSSRQAILAEADPGTTIYDDTKSKPWVTLPSTRDLIWRRMWNNPRETSTNGVPVPVTATSTSNLTSAHMANYGAIVEMEWANMRAQAGYTYNGVTSWSWSRNPIPTAARLVTPTSVTNLTGKYKYRGLVDGYYTYDKAGVTVGTPAAMGMANGGLLWRNTISSYTFIEVTRSGSSTAEYYDGRTSNGWPSSGYLTIGPNDSLYVGSLISSSYPGGPSAYKVICGLEPITPDWSLTSIRKTNRYMPTINGAVFQTSSSIKDYVSGWGSDE